MSAGLGRFGEEWAVGYLSRLGYRIVERNVRFRSGEIDIVARDGEELVFVEVKCRKGDRFGTPEESITLRRFARLTAAVEWYLAERGHQDVTCRIDVVALEVDRSGRVSDCRLLRGVEAPA